MHHSVFPMSRLTRAIFIRIYYKGKPLFPEKIICFLQTVIVRFPLPPGCFKPDSRHLWPRGWPFSVSVLCGPGVLVLCGGLTVRLRCTSPLTFSLERRRLSLKIQWKTKPLNWEENKTGGHQRWAQAVRTDSVIDSSVPAPQAGATGCPQKKGADAGPVPASTVTSCSSRPLVSRPPCPHCLLMRAPVLISGMTPPPTWLPRPDTWAPSLMPLWPLFPQVHQVSREDRTVAGIP